MMEKADFAIDVRGQICPYPLIMIKQAMEKMAVGQVLEVLTDYEPTVHTTIPGFCEKKGYPFEIREDGKNGWLALIRKSA